MLTEIPYRVGPHAPDRRFLAQHHLDKAIACEADSRRFARMGDIGSMRYFKEQAELHFTCAANIEREPYYPAE